MHFLIKRRIQSLYRDGYSEDELLIMYEEKITYDELKKALRGIKKPERI